MMGDDIAAPVRLLRLELLVRAGRQAALRQGKEHLGRCVHGHHDRVVSVAGSQPCADLLDVVEALGRASAPGRWLHLLPFHGL